jgi:iron complex transport system ATP-binding protein
MSEPLLEAAGITYRIGAGTLVDGVDLSGEAGEVVAIIGPNGAGKSTLLRLLAGDMRATAGSVHLAGAPVDSLSVAELAVVRSFLADREPDAIAFRAGAVVEMGRYPHRRRPENSGEADATAVREAMLRTDTLDLADRVFATLSRGERARVALARVIAQQAPVVMLDEPTGALDMAGQERMLTEARRLASEGRLVVAVMHDLNAAAYYSDRLLLLSNGRSVATGTPSQVLDSETLRAVYGQSMRVIDHPYRHCPLVLVGE